MRNCHSIQFATFFCVFTATFAFACIAPGTAGYAGVRIGRLCFYNGTCSRAMGASLLVYRQGEGTDVYFQPCAEMVENEATYLGGNQIFGFGKSFHPSRTWLCLPFWLVVTLWFVQLARSKCSRNAFRGEFNALRPTLVASALASILMLAFSPMLSITALTWSTVIPVSYTHLRAPRD